METRKSLNKGTSAGLHFVEDAICPRLFFLSHICNLEPTISPKGVIRGSAIHSAFELYYREGRNNTALIPTFESVMTEHASSLSDESFAVDLDAGKRMLTAWILNLESNDKSRYDVISIEEEYPVELPNGMLFTARIDRIMFDNEYKKPFIFDIKSTSYSIPATFTECEQGDQATGCIYAARKHSIPVEGFIPDILYCRGSTSDAQRFGEVYRTRSDLTAFELGITAQLEAITESVKQWESYDNNVSLIPTIWPRRHPWSKGCVFKDVCRNWSIAPESEIPVNFKRKELNHE